MLHRAMRAFMVVTLLFQIGCTKRVPVDVSPIRRPSDRIQVEEKVTAVLQEEMVVRGSAGADSLNTRPVEWRTMEITGRLVKWDEQVISIRVNNWRPGEDATFEIPLEQLEQVDEWPGFKPGPVLTTIAGTAIIIGLTVLIIWALSSPVDSL